jgi:phosphotransferase system  glucose/maltose/N-acetylglucosamine-specific IIC component
MVLSGIFVRFKHMFDILFFGLFPHLFLYTMEIGQIAFVIAVILFAIAIVVKIMKNKKAKKNIS